MYGGKGSEDKLELERRRIKVLKVLLLQKYGNVLTYVVEISGYISEKKLINQPFCYAYL